jgi:hypothetical protein
LKEGLKPLFDNYLEKYRSPMSVKELELVSWSLGKE